MIPCYVKLTVMLTGEPIWINMANKTTMVPSERSGTAILHQGTQVIVKESPEEIQVEIRESLCAQAAMVWERIQCMDMIRLQK